MPGQAAGRLPITAIVGSHNEADLLGPCLDALAFCDELIVVDIASTDETRAVAEARGARVIEHDWVPIAEQARAEAIAEARHDWLLIRDPDEVVPPGLERDLRELFPTLPPDVGLVGAPTQRFFGSEPIRGTVWGGVKTDRLLARRGLVEFPTAVHRRLPRRPGVVAVEIPYRGDNAILHYWVSGYRVFLERHLRYLGLEGPGRADAGEIASPRSVVLQPPRAFLRSYLRERGYRDGLRGLVLSLAWSAYRTGSELMLLRELRKRERHG
jgi:glycosyltransferase involved in cell wall biosynthesis